jgi:hypothetical protein
MHVQIVVCNRLLYPTTDGYRTSEARVLESCRRYGVLTSYQAIDAPSLTSSQAPGLYNYSLYSKVDISACQAGYEQPDSIRLQRRSCGSESRCSGNLQHRLARRIKNLRRQIITDR